MNKTTQLVLAAIAGFGLCAQARTSTNELWDVDFAGVTIPEAGSVQLSSVPSSEFADGAWTVQEDDESYVTNGVGRSDSLSNLLELNTQGNDLTWTPNQTGTGTVSIVESDIYFVGADDAPPPEGFDSVSNPAQTAMYLKNVYEDGEGVTQDEPQSYELYIWTWSETLNTNAWQKLDSAVTNENWHHVQILIDYEKSTPKVSVAVNGIVAADPSDPTVTSWTAASRGGGKTAVQTVSFKGTGRVDNFVGRSRVTSFDKAFFGAEVYVDGVKQPVGSEGNTTRYTAEKQEIGDVDNESKSVTFSQFAFDNFESGDEPIALSRITIITNGIETVYDYSGYYDSENGVFTGVPDGYPAEFALDKSGDQTGEFSISPLTHGATKGDVTNIVAKIYINTLDAYYAGAVVNVGEDSATYEKFVKPSDAGKTVSWTFPNTTNGTYVLRSVVVANGATFDSSTGVVSFEVPVGGIGSDKTYATVTYVEGGYDAEALEWVYDSSTGTYTLQLKTFTVAFTWHGGSSSDTYAYGDSLTAPTVDATYTEGGATWTFTGWSPAVPATVTAAGTYVAQYEMTSAPKATVIRIADGSVESFGSLADAIAAATTGDTVKLLDDCNTGIGIGAGTNIVLDLGGYTLSNPSDCPIWPMSGTLVVSNGTIRTVLTGASYSAVYVTGGDLTLGDDLVVDATVQDQGGGQGGFGVTVAYGGTLTVDGATINAREMCVFVYSQGNATVNVVDGTLTSTDNAVVGGYGTTGYGGNTINVSGGTLNASIVSAGYAACGIYAPNDDTVNISGGTINVTDGAGVVARAGSVNITGGTITTTGNTVGKVGDSRVVVPCAAVVFDSAANYPGNTDGDGAVTIEGGTFISDVSTVQTVADEGDEQSVFIPAVVNEQPNPARFADADAEGVEEGYRLVEDPENPGLYKVEPIVMHLLETAIALRYNCYTNVTVVDYPEGATFGWTISTNGVVFKPTQGPVPISSGKTTASVKVYAGATPFETATATVAVTNNGVQIGTLSATISLDDVAAVVDGVTYAKADLDAAAAAAIANNKVLGLYVNGPKVTLAEGQTLVSRVLSDRNTPTPTVSAPAGTAEKVYTVNTVIDNSTKTRTYSLTYDTPTVMYTSTDGETVEYLDAKFKISKNGTYKLLKDVTRDQLSVGNYTAVLDLAGHAFTSTVSGTKGAIYVDSLIGSASLTIRDTVGGGSVVAENCYTIWGNRNATIAIEGGSIVGKADVVYLSAASDSLSISGGSFQMANNGSPTYMLNMLDSARGSITVTGGSFKGFDPMNNTAEGAGTDFVALTHASVADSPSAGWYTVVPAYTVTWNDEDGTALETDTRVATGVTPSFDGETPAKASTAQYDFGFDAWTPAIEAVASNTVYTATYTETLRTYTITWANYDNTVLDTDEVAYGATPEYAGETPVKPNEGDTEFEFDGWSPAIVPVEGAATYVAQFKEKENGTVIVITDAGATTNYFATLPLAFAAAVDGDTVALLANQNLDERVFVNAGATPVYAGTNNRYATTSDNRSLTLDLNGHSITNSSNIALAGGSLNITGSGEIATTASGLAPVEVRGTGDLASKRTLTVGPDVTLAGGEYGLNVFGSNDAQKNVIDVTVNGSVKGTLFVLGNLKNAENEINIVVNGSVIAPAGVGDDVVVGIALNGNANVTVNDGAVVSGDSGIEVRAGNLTVNGGTITATADSYSYKANGSGSTTKGAAISVAQHTTALSMTATLNGGTLVGVEEIYVKDVNNNNLSNVGVVATKSFAEDATVPEGFAWIDNGEGDYVLTKVWVVTYANYDGTVLQVTTNVTGVATPAYAGETPVKPSAGGYDYTFTGWDPAVASTVTADATYTAQFAEESAEEDHVGAKSEEGFVILAPADGDYDSTKPLTFAAPDLTAGTVAISASMICPENVTEVTLTLLYKTDLTAAEYSKAQVTVGAINAEAGTATVTLPANLGDTVFFFGFDNELGVTDTNAGN